MGLKKVEKKVSLNIKITAELDARLKRARKIARENDCKFNVSQEVEAFLEKEVKRVEKILSITQDVNEEKNQLDLLKKWKKGIFFQFFEVPKSHISSCFLMVLSLQTVRDLSGNFVVCTKCPLNREVRTMSGALLARLA